MNPRSEDILSRLTGSICCEACRVAMVGLPRKNLTVPINEEAYAVVTMDPIFRCDQCGMIYTVQDGYSLNNEPRKQTWCGHHVFSCFYVNVSGKQKCPSDGCAFNCRECGRLQAKLEQARWDHELAPLETKEELRIAVDKALQEKRSHQARCTEKT